MSLLIETRRLSFAYPGGSTILDQIDFQMKLSDVVVIVGPNGAGKSTLLLHLAALLPEPLPVNPSVLVSGIPVSEEHVLEVRRTVGMMFQDPDDQLFCPTLIEDVQFGPRHLGLSRVEVSERAEQSLMAVGLWEIADRPIHRLSLGEKRRGCLAGVLACRPSILLLDEPTSHLDPRSRRQLTELLKTLSLPMVIATHDLEFALMIGNRALVMSGGRFHADGAPIELFADGPLMEGHGLEVPVSLQRS